MIHSGKKINILTLVLSEKKILNETKKHNPPPFKLNGRFLTSSSQLISLQIFVSSANKYVDAFTHSGMSFMYITNGMGSGTPLVVHKPVDKYIPQRTIKHQQHGYPWITTELQRMIRKRYRLYNKIKKMGNTKMRNDYKHLKHLVQKETRKSY